MKARAQKEIMAGVSNLHLVDKDDTLIKSGLTSSYAPITGDIANQLITSLQAQVASLTEQNQDLREQLSQEREHSREQAGRITDLVLTLAKKIENDMH